MTNRLIRDYRVANPSATVEQLIADRGEAIGSHEKLRAEWAMFDARLGAVRKYRATNPTHTVDDAIIHLRNMYIPYEDVESAWKMVGLRPILFRSELGHAIRRGQKVETRRPAAPGAAPGAAESRRYGRPGDLLWVRERHRLLRLDGSACGPDEAELVQYWEEDRPRRLGALDEVVAVPSTIPRPRWRPSIHMPLRACRLVLEVQEVRVERLQLIDWWGVLCEGIGWGRVPHEKELVHLEPSAREEIYEHLLDDFGRAWNEIYGPIGDVVDPPRALRWEDDPLVEMVRFRPVAGLEVGGES